MKYQWKSIVFCFFCMFVSLFVCCLFVYLFVCFFVCLLVDQLQIISWSIMINGWLSNVPHIITVDDILMISSLFFDHHMIFRWSSDDHKMITCWSLALHIWHLWVCDNWLVIPQCQLLPYYLITCGVAQIEPMPIMQP